MSNVSWAPPVFGNANQTSQAYLQRLQDFLAAQSGDSNMSSSTDKPNNKRKGPASNAEIDTTAALKDSRRQSSSGSASTSGSTPAASQRSPGSNGQAQHSHADQQRSESPPDATTSSGSSKKKTSTTDKRKEQNRNAQRAFRERKERVLKDLEDKIEGLNKINEDQMSENQNLRELVQRLQDENSRLQQQGSGAGGAQSSASAPQSSFTFSMPANLSSSTSSNNPNANADNAPASFSSDQDILAFLSTPAQPAPPSQVPALIHGAETHSSGNSSSGTSSGGGFGSGSGSGGMDDWMWNASAFGTEIPQAIPPSVTNISEAQKAGLVFPWDQYTGAGNAGSSPASASASGAGSAGAVPSNDAAAFASFLSSFSPAASSASPAGTTQQKQQQAPSRPATLPAQVQQRASSNNGAAADSPETSTCSSGASSDPSDAAFPATPGSAMPFLFNNSYSGNGSNNAGTLSFASLAGNAFAGQTNPAFLGYQHQQQQNSKTSFSASDTAFDAANANGSGNRNASRSSSFFSPGNMATTPSSVFDMMNYRDPLFASFDAENAGTGAGASPGQFAGFGGPSPGVKSELVDFSDFLVASPPALSGGGVDGSSGTAQQQPYFRTDSTTSSSSVPTRASTSASASASSANSPNTSMGAHRSASSSSVSASGGAGAGASRVPPLGSGSIADVFPHPISYQHPLIGHVMGNLHMEKQAKEGRPVDRAEAERERDDMGKLLNMQNETWGGLAGARKSKSPSPATNATPGVPAGSFGMACAWPKSQVPHDVDVDGLCDEMLMKASCKEMARQQLQKSINEDEQTLKLYNQYLAENAGAKANADAQSSQPF